MASIVKKNVVSSDMQNRVVYKGSNVPPWYADYTNLDNWYWASNNPPDVCFFYNDVEDNVYVQYGKDEVGWASARFFGQSVEIVEEEQLDNGDIRVKVNVQAKFFNGRKNSRAVEGYRVKYVIKINNVVQYTFDGNTIDSFSNGEKPVQTFEVIVKPQETSNTTAMIIDIEYPNGEFDGRELIVGFGLFNPNPVTYTPMAIRKSGSWKDLDRNNGKIQRRINNVWVDKSEENIETIRQANKGKNRLRVSGSFRQLPPMRNGEPQ